jgi:hypothetical protein
VQTKRDLRIDTLRGLALLGMTVAHVHFSGMPRAFPIIGYVGPAEPFVVLSGLVAGMIYWRYSARASAAEVWRKGLGRTGFVYLNYVGLALGIVLLTLVYRSFDPSFLPYGMNLVAENPLRAALLVPVFLFQPGYADILPMYIFFVAITPLVVLSARAGRLGLCVALSAGLWLLAQLGTGDRLLEPVAARLGSRLGYFDVLGWQFVYVIGLVLGIRAARGDDPVVPRAPWFVGLALAIVVLCYFTAHGAFGLPQERYGLGWIEDRSSFGPLRVLNTGAWIVVLARLGSVHSPWFEWRWPAFLGAHSMIVFVYSCFLGYLITPLDAAPEPVKVAAVVLGLASLTIPAWLQQRWRLARAGALTAAPAPPPLPSIR